VSVDTKTCRARRTAVFGIRYASLTHADVIAFGHNESQQFQKAIIIYFTVQIHREHSLLALNLGLKYEIQVPNIGGEGKCIVAPSQIIGVHGPPVPLSRPHDKHQNLISSKGSSLGDTMFSRCP